TALVGNFLVLPLLVFALVAGLDVFGRALAGSRLEVDALSLGLLLVLLVPCTDWFLTFVHLARGDRAAAAVITPVNLVVQLGMLPLYLALFSSGRTPVLEPGPVAAAAGVVLLPLLAATLFERFLRASPQEHLRRERLGRWPIPLLAVVMLFVAVTHVPAALAAPGVLWIGVLVCVVFLGAAVGLAWILAEIAGLGTAQRATLMCTMGTRNSFVVLPVAVALPAGWELAAAVIVVQGLIELLGMAGV
ncbi:MAG: hypothetical protein Q4G34_10910, partial [Micrococcus sp.]|nr:hypothetical protein [Micrococcus sp.]